MAEKVSEEEVESGRKAVEEISVSGGGYMELYPQILRNKLSSSLIDAIVRSALEAAARVRESKTDKPNV